MSCPRCGATVPAQARFCAACGLAVDADEATLAALEERTFAPAAAAAADALARPSPPSGHKSSSGGWLTSSDSISHGRFPPGAVLDGRYRIVGLLGRGGMGEVYRADDLRLGQPVALKFLPDSVGSDAVRLAQFHNEVRTARQVSHPNICRVYDIGEVDGRLFLSMEFVAGEDLSTSLRRIGRFPEDKATEIARQLCAGLAAAHERGVVHRDLKPANVMLDDTGKVRLMDFGLAAAGSVDNIRAGTPAYMAPEQLLGREVTARSDIYALGLVLYELFTGRRVFSATTLNELIEQHQGGRLTPPSEIVTALDPAIERAMLRCLDPDPARRPSTALALSAALPGGDPLAAALAAGETPSPEIVAAAGEGAGLRGRVAVPVFIAILLGVAASYGMALRTSPLEGLRPEYNADVLAQKARDALRQIGYADRPQDEAYWFGWDDSLIDFSRDSRNALPWRALLSQRPSPLVFRYRRSPFAMIGFQFHHDLLTPGLVDALDPPPIYSNQIQLTLDHQGFLTALEAIPPQVQQATEQSVTVDWTMLLKMAGLDAASLQPATPEWHWLAAADARIAWTGTWPGTMLPLRIEGASLDGRPVAFHLIGPWTKPWRMATNSSDGETAMLVVIFALALTVVIGGTLLARKNLRERRGDQRGALQLATSIVAALWVLWICQAHFVASTSMLGIFLLAIVTTVFYGALFWSTYLALEPFVRRYWPQTLVSWTTVLGGRVRDPIVGRDVLFGVALGVATALLVRSTILWTDQAGWPPLELLLGLRSSAGEIVMHALYAVRNALFVFFLLFLLRVLLRNQWAAAIVFAFIFGLLDALDSRTPLIEGATSFLYFAMSAIAVLRWGLTTLTVGVLVADLLLVAPATTESSAWYLGATFLVIAIPVALATWAFFTSVRERLWKADLLT